MKQFENIMKHLEKERFNILGIFLAVFWISLIRSIVEAHIFNYQYIIIDYAHTISFYLCTFVMFISVIKIMTRERTIKIANATIWFFSLLPLAPLLDYFLLHRTTGYEYIPLRSFPDLLFIGPSEVTGVFQILIVGVILSFLCFYVGVKTKKISRISITFLLCWICILIVSTPWINPILDYQTATPTTMLLYFMFLIMIFSCLLLKLSKKGLFTLMFRSMRIPPMILGALVVIIGFLYAGRLHLFDIQLYPFSDTLGIMIIAIVSIASTWFFTVFINHLYDVEIDRITCAKRITVVNLITHNQIRQISMLFALISILLATLLDYQVFFLVLLALFLGTIYSVPPLRFRNKIYSPIFLGSGFTIFFLVGAMTPYNYLIPFTYTVPYHEIFLVSLVIFSVFSVGTVIKDLKDIKGDKKNGVQNIFTVYGKEKGMKITSLLLMASFLSFLVIFNNLQGVLLVGIMSVFAVLIFYIFKRMEMVFIVHFSLFILLLISLLS